MTISVVIKSAVLCNLWVAPVSLLSNSSWSLQTNSLRCHLREPSRQTNRRITEMPTLTELHPCQAKSKVATSLKMMAVAVLEQEILVRAKTICPRALQGARFLRLTRRKTAQTRQVCRIFRLRRTKQTAQQKIVEALQAIRILLRCFLATHLAKLVELIAAIVLAEEAARLAHPWL